MTVKQIREGFGNTEMIIYELRESDRNMII